MASYNHEQYVRAMIDSVLTQTIRDLELIIVDDGSTDRTPTIAQECADRDERVRVIQQSNAGIVASRNRGFELSSGEYVSFIDSDDLLEQDRTARLLSTLEDNPDAVMAYGDAWIEDVAGRRTSFWSKYPVRSGNTVDALLWGGCFIPAVGVLCRRTALLKSGPLWGGGGSTDYLKWLQLSTQGKVVQLSGKPVGIWRHHRGNLSQSSGRRRVEQYTALADDLDELSRRLQSEGIVLSHKALAFRRGHCLAMAGYYYALQGDIVPARTYYWRSLRSAISLKAVLGLLLLTPPFHLPSRYLLQIIEKRR